MGGCMSCRWRQPLAVITQGSPDPPTSSQTVPSPSHCQMLKLGFQWNHLKFNLFTYFYWRWSGKGDIDSGQSKHFHQNLTSVQRWNFYTRLPFWARIVVLGFVPSTITDDDKNMPYIDSYFTVLYGNVIRCHIVQDSAEQYPVAAQASAAI